MSRTRAHSVESFSILKQSVIQGDEVDPSIINEVSSSSEVEPVKPKETHDESISSFTRVKAMKKSFVKSMVTESVSASKVAQVIDDFSNASAFKNSTLSQKHPYENKISEK